MDASAIQITELINAQFGAVEVLRNKPDRDAATEAALKIADDVLQALCSIRWIMVALDTRTEQVEELKQALSECLLVTKTWHCQGMPNSLAEACWNSYKKGAPEMASIMAVVAKHANGKEASNG